MNYFKERYYVQLDSPQWKAFRKEFIARKGGRCELCEKTGPGLQVHDNCPRKPTDSSVGGIGHCLFKRLNR